MTTYPARTLIVDIKNFDRSTKVEFECAQHPKSKWVSKDPFTSSWFSAPSNTTPTGQPIENCMCPTARYVTSTEYTS